MTMYHMAMPPHMGGPHPPPVHSPLFPSPILPPPMPHSYAVHSFPQTHVPHPSPSAHSSHSSHQSHPSHSTAAAVGAASVSIAVGSGNSALLTHPSPMLSQPSPIYPPQTSVYVNPYLPPQLPHTHAHSHPQHQHPSNMGYGMPPAMGGGPPPGMLPLQQSSSQATVTPMTSVPVLSVDEELFEEMNTLHLGYIETEDSPHKLEQREKLERVIMEYLAITPHSHKFMFHQISEVLETSINNCNDFSAYGAACAFDALAQYAANLITQPWRREFRGIKLYSGFWVHQVAHHLAGAEPILSLMGYVPQSNPPAGSSSYRDPSCLVLEGVLDPDLISRLALDCLIAYCECQVLKKISEGVREFGLTWRQILQFRHLYVGGVDVTVRHLLFTLRQRLQPQSQAESCHKQATPSTGPPLPVRQSSMSGPSSSPVSTHQSAPALHQAPEKVIAAADQIMSLEQQQQQRINTTGMSSRGASLEQRSVVAAGVGGGGGATAGGGGAGAGGGGSYHHQSLHHLHHHPSCQTPPVATTTTTTTTVGVTPIATSGTPPSYCRSVDIPDTVKSISSLGILPPASQVPTAKLIDLDSSLENLPSRTSLQLLPKVLPHKRSSKSSGSSRVLPPLENSESCPPPPPPPEVFQAGTLDEHLEATLSIVKDPNRNSVVQNTPNEHGATSWETWDFVFRGLEKRGYNKDIGDRGDILHQITRQNLHADASTPQGKSIPLNNKKEIGRSKPVSFNQALQALSLNETRERVERPCPSSKSSHSASHGATPDVFPGLTKRNSLYDNISAGFETAPQDSDDYEDRRPILKKTSNLVRIDNRLDVSNKNNTSSSSSPRSLSLSSKGSHSRQELPSEASRCAATASTIQQGGGGIAITDNSSTPPRDNQPPRESLLPQVPWSCTTCTFLNDKGRSACDMCGKSRMPGPETRPLISGGRQCPQCTLINEREAQDCSACGVHLEGSSTYI